MGFCETKASYQNQGYGKNFKYRKKVSSPKLVSIEYPAFKEFDGECFERMVVHTKKKVRETFLLFKMIYIAPIIFFISPYPISTIFGVRKQKPRLKKQLLGYRH